MSEISTDDLVEFMLAERWSLPLVVEQWVDHVLGSDAAPLAACV